MHDLSDRVSGRLLFVVCVLRWGSTVPMHDLSHRASCSSLFTGCCFLFYMTPFLSFLGGPCSAHGSPSEFVLWWNRALYLLILILLVVHFEGVSSGVGAPSLSLCGLWALVSHYGLCK
jgi:hypothetical protein